MSNWDEVLMSVLSVPIIAAVYLFPFYMPRLTLWGLAQFTDGPLKWPRRFRLCDLLCLFVYFSAANGFLPNLAQEWPRTDLVFWAILANILATCVWLTRDVVYCRFPLIDGAGNPASRLRIAVDTVFSLIFDTSKP